MLDPIQAQIEKLERHTTERDKLMHELKCSLAVQYLYSDAFKHGSCTARVVHVDGVGITSYTSISDLVFILTLPSHSTIVFELKDTPYILLPSAIQQHGLKSW